MRKKKLIAFSLLFCVLPLFLGFRVQDDFSWLGEFTPLTETVTVEHWEKDARITFDTNGYVQVSKQSNPVTLSQYALVCFDTYRSTGDNKYKKAFLNQVKYLMSEKQYKELSPERIGYPYNYTFHDLKPDWYSGLAQAEAICVLIRYYYLTKDDKVLPLIRKLKNQMVWPMEDGGLLAKTPEGGPWIEEYPNSKQNKHVLNGFLISLFGLYEYTRLFPEDKPAKETYVQCLQSLKESVDAYDTGSWLTYDRGTRSQVSNWYMKAQVVEIKLIHSITGDDFFYRLHQLWSTYAYNKPLTYIGCRINEKNFSIPARLAADGWYLPAGDFSNVTGSTGIIRYANGTILPGHGCNLLFDKLPATYFQPLVNDTTDKDSWAEFTFKNPIKADRISFVNLKDSAADYSILLEHKTDSASRWKEIPVRKSYYSGKEWFFQFNESEMSALRVHFRLKKNTIVMIAEMNIQSSKKTNDAVFAHYTSDPIQVDKKKVNFNFETRDISQFTVFYKYGNSRSELMKAKWDPMNYTRSLPFESESCGLMYQYLVVFKLESVRSGIRNIKTS